MFKKIKFNLRQIMKMILQNAVLPSIYAFWKCIYRKEPQLIIFADAHHREIPYSMQKIHSELEKKGYSIVDVFEDYSSMSFVGSSLCAVRFMRLYAKAKAVFICDNFLPVASCRKRKETKVIQLWHSCGLLKKMGYDTTEDIPANYKGNVYRNYDLLTVSAPPLEEVFAKATGHKRDVVRSLGVSRTDVFFDESWLKECEESFFAAYPSAKNKKIILWAPTFRGNAHDPYQVGAEDIKELEKKLGDGYFVISKVHPHVDSKYKLSSTDIPTERLLAVTDLLITDYSSVFFDFLFFNKPCILFAPDLKEYEEKRGFYVNYSELCPNVVTDSSLLESTVLSAIEKNDISYIDSCKQFHVSSCDGNSTKRILDYLNL